MNGRMMIEDVKIRICRDTEPGFVLPGEAPDGYKLTWVESGRLHSVADGQDTPLLAGELLLYRPGQWHMQYADMDDAPHFITVVLGQTGMDLSGLAGKKLIPGEDASLFLSQALRELQMPDPYSESMVLAALEMALVSLLRTYSSTEAEQAVPSIHTENQIIRRAQQYVSAHIREKLTVPLVAKKSGVSPSYLTALFHKHLGISPGEYIRRIKLQESKALIKAGDLNFTEIAAVLNYSTVHHFSRQFKEKFGISPTEYAKSIKP